MPTSGGDSKHWGFYQKVTELVGVVLRHKSARLLPTRNEREIDTTFFDAFGHKLTATSFLRELPPTSYIDSQLTQPT
jgi:hypothetical protein